MPIINARPVRFTPRGIADAYDSTDVFPGACRSMQNLIFDQSNPEILISRPGVGTAITTFSGFTTPTFVSVYIVIGVMVYGMVSTGRNAGKDEPFAYNTATNTFITISGVTNANSPTSPATTGAWTPPTMAVISTKIIVTHPGFGGVGNFFGVLDITTPATPAWSSANTATNALPSVPLAVANFGNRAYFACANVSYFSDVLVPTTITNATQSITHGDTTPITGYSGLPLTTTSGGVIAGLIVFKAGQIWQVTGDAALNNLTNNFISLVKGTNAPRSIVQNPNGTFFIADDGPYVVDSLGQLRPITRQGVLDQDLQQPFENATTPSRMAAGYAGDTYRVCVDTILLGVNQTNDYWFSTHRGHWQGPHTWPYDCCAQLGSTFVLSHQSKGAALFISQEFPRLSSVYNDNGTAITCKLQSATFPKDGRMTMKSIVESTLELSSSGVAVVYTVSALDDQNNLLNQCTISVPGNAVWGGGSTWGGGGLWASANSIPHPYNVPWTAPVVANKFALLVQGTANASLSIGTYYGRTEDLGYTNQG